MPLLPHRDPAPPARPAARALVLAFAAAGAIAIAVGCASSTAATDTKTTVKCTPGNYVFCRCQDREEGTKLCNEDGHSFGACEPCESATNPALPDDPGHPPAEVEAGTDGAPQPTAVCGDGTVQDGEDCDDGNKVEDDGCDSACHLAGTDPLATRSCPGLDTHVWSKPVSYVGTTIGSTFRGNLSPACTSTVGGNPTSGSSGPDRVFHVTAHKTGKMTVAATDNSYDALIYVTTKCLSATDPVTYLACANDANGTGNETMSFPVTAGASYSVLVDGAGISNYQGAFRVTFSIQ